MQLSELQIGRLLHPQAQLVLPNPTVDRPGRSCLDSRELCGWVVADLWADHQASRCP